MLSVHPDTICFIIAKAREFQAKEQVVIPETPSSPSDDWALQVLADHIDDLSLLEVKTTVQDLSPEQQAELVALMCRGRPARPVRQYRPVPARPPLRVGLPGRGADPARVFVRGVARGATLAGGARISSAAPHSSP